MKIVRLLVMLFMVTGALVTTFYHCKLGENEKQYRYLLMMSSFKRPIFVTGQVYRLMNQTYQNFDLSISLKGVDEKYSRLTFEKELWPYIDRKRLFLRYDANRAQLSNLLDAARDVNLEKYDWFCKIDDDDWYAPEYLENVNNELNDALKEGLEVNYTETANAYILRENIHSTKMYYNNTDWKGPTMCFSRKFIKMLLMIEEEPSLIGKYLPKGYKGLQAANEDKLIAHLAYIHKIKKRYSTEPLVIYGQQYPSVTRNDDYFHSTNETVNKKNIRKLGYQ